MLTALSTGHDGSLCTVHAGSPAEALRRIEVLALMSDLGLPHAAIREQVADAFDLVVCQARTADGARRVVAVAEVVRVAAGPAARELYAWRDGAPRWRAAITDAPGRTAGGRMQIKGQTLYVRRARLEAAAACAGAARLWRGRLMALALAFAAAVAGVVGAWELLAAVERSRVAAVAARLVAPVVRAGREGVVADDRRAAAARRARGGGARRGRVARRRGGRRAARRRRRPGDRDRARARPPPPLPARARRVRAGRRPRARRCALRRPLGARRARRRRDQRARRGRPRAARRRAGAAARRAHRHDARAPAPPRRRRRRGTRSSPASCSSATPAATCRRCCATSPPRSRPPRARTATRSPRPPRRASRRGWCSALPIGAALLAELAQPGPAREPARQSRSRPGSTFLALLLQVVALIARPAPGPQRDPVSATLLAIAAAIAAAAGLVDLCSFKRRRGVLTALVARLGASLGMQRRRAAWRPGSPPPGSTGR